MKINKYVQLKINLKRKDKTQIQSIRRQETHPNHYPWGTL